MDADIKRAVWDLETNGFLESVTKIHCLVIRDIPNRAVTRWCDVLVTKQRDGTVLQGLAHLFALHNEHGYHIGGHNTIKYDHPVVEKLFPGMFKVNKLMTFDTMVMARVIFSDVKETDAKLLKQGKLPPALFGRHSLEAWGVRLGLLKGDFGKKETEEDESNVWEHFTREMLDYCDQDTKVTLRLLNHLLAVQYSQQAIDLEHKIQWVMAQMERNGFRFNEQKAAEFLVKLIEQRDALEEKLKQTFHPWEVQLPDFIPARNNKTLGYIQGVPVPRSKTVMFNPRSRDHIAARLTALYGWVPTEFTDGGKPKVDEDVMKELDYPEAPLLTEYLTVSKTLGQLSEGKNAWLKLVTSKGFIHGSINPNGAVTGRATHSRPNVSQVPNAAHIHGKPCRELFTVPDGWILVGADASGLELRCLAHYMARWDGGSYGTAVVDGDIHTLNQIAAGLPTRDNAKTFIYGYLYGAGDELIGKIVNGDAARGKALKAQFLKGLPALKHLKQALTDRLKVTRYIVGLDGRQVFVRSAHSALNTLLQSAGALVCKQWVVLIEDTLQSLGLKHGWDGDYALCAWSHDEVQIACRNEQTAQVVRWVAEGEVTYVGHIFNFRCRLNGESKQGTTWAQTH